MANRRTEVRLSNEPSGIELFKNEIRFLEILLLISTLLIVIIDKMSTAVSSNFFFLMFIVLALAYYFVVDFKVYENKKIFWFITGLTAIFFAGSIALAIGMTALFASNLIIADVMSTLYLGALAVLSFLILAKPVITLSLKEKRRVTEKSATMAEETKPDYLRSIAISSRRLEILSVFNLALFIYLTSIILWFTILSASGTTVATAVSTAIVYAVLTTIGVTVILLFSVYGLPCKGTSAKK